jgi:hypothetical protein
MIIGRGSSTDELPQPASYCRTDADDTATKLDLTPSAVRAQITAMERDGVVIQVLREAQLLPGGDRQWRDKALNIRTDVSRKALARST